MSAGNGISDAEVEAIVQHQHEIGWAAGIEVYHTISILLVDFSFLYILVNPDHMVGEASSSFEASSAFFTNFFLYSTMDSFYMLLQVRAWSESYVTYLTNVFLDFMMNHFDVLPKVVVHIESFWTYQAA